MPANYIITEPAPSTTSYIRSGRGGAGNTHRISSASSSASSSRPASSTIVAAKPAKTQSKTSRFFSGIGGAGNAHEAHERPAPALLVDDEFRRAAARESNPGVGHCGIGGAGNVFRRKASDASDESSDRGSIRSSMSEKLWARVNGS